MPVTCRSPVGRRRFAQGRSSAPAGRPGGSDGPTAAPKASRTASNASSGASVSANQIRARSMPRRRWSQWPSACGRRSPRTWWARARTRPPRLPGGRAGVQDGRRGQPERGDPGGQGLGGRALAIEPELRHALHPLPDPGELERRPGQRLGELDEVEPRGPGREGAAPQDRAIRAQADLAQERRRARACAGCHSSRSPGSRRSRAPPAAVARRITERAAVSSHHHRPTVARVTRQPCAAFPSSLPPPSA